MEIILTRDVRYVRVREEGIEDIFEGLFVVMNRACLGCLFVITANVFELCWWLVDGQLFDGRMDKWLERAARDLGWFSARLLGFAYDLGGS